MQTTESNHGDGQQNVKDNQDIFQTLVRFTILAIKRIPHIKKGSTEIKQKSPVIVC